MAVWHGTDRGSERGNACRRTDERSAQIRVLGPVSVSRDGVPVPLPRSRKVRALLAFLALGLGPVSRSRLCDLLWDVPNDPRGELRWCLSKLRGVLDDAGPPSRRHQRHGPDRARPVRLPRRCGRDRPGREGGHRAGVTRERLAELVRSVRRRPARRRRRSTATRSSPAGSPHSDTAIARCTSPCSASWRRARRPAPTRHFDTSTPGCSSRRSTSARTR